MILERTLHNTEWNKAAVNTCARVAPIFVHADRGFVTRVLPFAWHSFITLIRIRYPDQGCVTTTCGFAPNLYIGRDAVAPDGMVDKVTLPGYRHIFHSLELLIH